MKDFRLILIPLPILLLLLCLISPTVQEEATSDQDEGKQYSLQMPDIRPMKQDTYLCTAFKAPSDDSEYIVEYTPKLNQDLIFHLLLYGCEVPGKLEEEKVWDCSPPDGPKEENFEHAPICSSGQRILYSWSEGAPGYKLPEGIGFKIGKGTGVNYLVLRLYYLDVTEILNGGSDSSGVVLTVLPGSTNKITNRAGLINFKSKGVIQPGTTEHFEAACEIRDPVHLHPFAFRIHTHALGEAVAGYDVDKQGNWILIGKADPQNPNKFYPVQNSSLVITQGDIVASRCTMYNFRDRAVRIGATVHDEMCVFYIMYYVDGDQPLDLDDGCKSSGPPTYYWAKDPRLSVPPSVNKQASDPTNE